MSSREKKLCNKDVIWLGQSDGHSNPSTCPSPYHHMKGRVGMKQLFRLAIVLFSLFILIGCGQSSTESDTTSFSEAATYETVAQTKMLFETDFDSENEEDEDGAENDETETASTSDESTLENINEKNNSNDVATASTETQSEDSSNNQNSNAETQESNGGANQSTGSQSSEQQSQNNEQASRSSSTNTNKSSGSNSNGNNSKSNTKTNTVTVTVESPKDLNGPNMGPITVEISNGDTVYTVTEKALNGTGIEIQKTGSGSTLYVIGIGGLAEFDAGPLSGWNVLVDGAKIPRSADAFEVTDGQRILWRYTKNYLED